VTDNAQERVSKFHNYEYTHHTYWRVWRLGVITTLQSSFVHLANVSAFKFSVNFGTFK
jgi:hypothetical protein